MLEGLQDQILRERKGVDVDVLILGLAWVQKDGSDSFTDFGKGGSRKLFVA